METSKSVIISYTGRCNTRKKPYRASCMRNVNHDQHDKRKKQRKEKKIFLLSSQFYVGRRKFEIYTSVGVSWRFFQVFVEYLTFHFLRALFCVTLCKKNTIHSRCNKKKRVWYGVIYWHLVFFSFCAFTSTNVIANIQRAREREKQGVYRSFVYK